MQSVFGSLMHDGGGVKLGRYVPSKERVMVSLDVNRRFCYTAISQPISIHFRCLSRKKVTQVYANRCEQARTRRRIDSVSGLDEKQPKRGMSIFLIF